MLGNIGSSKQERKILVIGGGGFYGRYLVNDLLKFTNADIIIASRNPSNVEWSETNRVQLVRCDLADSVTLESLASKSDVVVHCAGPFQTLPLNPLRAAIRAGVNYVDVSEDRTYYKEVRKLTETIRQAGITVLSGMSVAPAMEILFANLITSSFDSLTSVRTFAAPDTRKHRGKAMFHTMLLGVGRSFMQPKDGKLRKVWGWTEPEWVEFPPPLGKRLTYLVLEMADLDLLPELFEVKTVEFKAGTEWAFLNRLLGMAAGIRKITGYPNWENFTLMVRAFSWLMGRFGKDEGGAVFEIKGFVNNLLITRRIAIIAKTDGGIIPAILASIATKKLISGDLQKKGLIPLNDWISAEELLKEFADRNLEIWWKPDDTGRWRLFDYVDYQRYMVE